MVEEITIAKVIFFLNMRDFKKIDGVVSYFWLG